MPTAVDATGNGPGASPPTVDEVERIAELGDPVLRNLRITESYHRLSAALGERLGSSANWCTFATWASKQAGQTIRRQDLARAFETGFHQSPQVAEALDRTVQTLLRRTWHRDGTEIERVLRESLHPEAAFARASTAVARGNLKVFAEIAREFARFLTDLGNDRGPAEARLEAFCTGLAPGEPPDGQGRLQTAFRHCYRAFFEADAKRRAENILRMNLEIGFHEQIRLQPEIAAALEAPVADARALRRQILGQLFTSAGLMRWALELYLASTTSFGRFWGEVTDLARHHARAAITEQMMTLELPGETLRLGRDLRARYPPHLARLTDPELVLLVSKVDPSPGGTRGSGADDWADFPQRMHFIAEFFRSHQESPDLLAAPFRPDQIERIRRGEMPSGRL